jgi:hypothetical protein
MSFPIVWGTFMRSVGRLLKSALAYHRAPPRMLLVMGMHRSGTSCVTRVLSLMGASLGPVDGRWVPGSDELHWESGEVNWINDEILSRTGGTWQAPPVDVRASLRDYLRCRQLLWQFAGSAAAVLKDPRMLLTYPVWRAVLPTHRLVVCLRHPVAVGRSLARRDGMTLSQGLRLWSDYSQRLLEHLGHAPQVHWVNFDEGTAGVRRLVRNVSGIWGLEATPEALNYYRADAHHHRDPDELPADVARVYEALMERARASLEIEVEPGVTTFA